MDELKGGILLGFMLIMLPVFVLRSPRGPEQAAPPSRQKPIFRVAFALLGCAHLARILWPEHLGRLVATVAALDCAVGCVRQLLFIG